MGRRLTIWLLLVAVAGWAGTAPPESLRLVSYNLHNYGVPGDRTPKSEASRQAVIQTLHRLDPDIALLIEVGDRQALDEIVSRLRQAGSDYPFASLVESADEQRHLAVISKTSNVKTQHNVTSTYRIRQTTVDVRRGFAHCLFTWDNGYRLHLLGAHLKSKMYHRLGQTDMRRYESRLLHYYIRDLLAKDPCANIILLGDMNDEPKSAPINTLRSRRSNPVRQMYDLRPLTPDGYAWTHYWPQQDLYSRIDYGFASYHLLPEIDFSQSRICQSPDWLLASDHLPLLITLTPQEKSASPALLESFKSGIRDCGTE
jgi:endonuclease/exonuclease/phosphatase family metal-dependent hydrolase